jgi:hypothetical protein
MVLRWPEVEVTADVGERFGDLDAGPGQVASFASEGGGFSPPEPADARTHYFYNATVNSPAMSMHLIRAGSQYAWGYRDSSGDIIDGGKNYTLTLPKDVPQVRFWSICLYDNQSRSMLRTPQGYPNKASWRSNDSLVNDQLTEYVTNKDGSITLYFGPEAPEGKEANWIQSIPGKGWFCLFRLYSPLMSWYDKTWRIGEIELVE